MVNQKYAGACFEDVMITRFEIGAAQFVTTKTAIFGSNRRSVQPWIYHTVLCHDDEPLACCLLECYSSVLMRGTVATVQWRVKRQILNITIKLFLIGVITINVRNALHTRRL